MCDSNEISLDTAAQIVIAALQSHSLSLPFEHRLSAKEKRQIIKNRAKVLFDAAPGFDPKTEADFRRQAVSEIRRMGLLLDATYLRAMVYAIANQELPERK